MTRSNVEIPDDVQAWVSDGRYKEGFFTHLATDELAKGINEEVVRAISAKRNEPEWMLEFRLGAYRSWLEMEEPHWLKAITKVWITKITAIILRHLVAAVMITVIRSPEPCSNPLLTGVRQAMLTNT